MNNAKESFQKQRSSLIFVLNAYRSKANFKKLLQILRKKTLFNTLFTFSASFLETKNVAKFFSTYFENNNLKSETRELVTNVTTEYNLFLKVSSVDHVGNNHICSSRK